MSDDVAYAAVPFDHVKGDIILRSSDNVDFRIFKSFLSLASPVFETLFDIPQPVGESEDQEIRDGLAVVPMAEDSKTLDALLRFCYPCTLADDPKLEVLQDALDVLNAAKKYSLDAIEMKARQVIANPKILEVQPLRCFAIAHRGGLREETLLAAKVHVDTAAHPSVVPRDRLAQRKRTALPAHLPPEMWGGCGHVHNWLSGRYYSDGCNNSCGWEDFMQETFTELQDKPCKATVQASVEKTVQAVKAKNCQASSPKITEGMHKFVDLFVRKIEETVAQIEMEFSFEVA